MQSGSAAEDRDEEMGGKFGRLTAICLSLTSVAVVGWSLTVGAGRTLLAVVSLVGLFTTAFVLFFFGCWRLLDRLCR